jgi:hypothetical protein
MCSKVFCVYTLFTDQWTNVFREELRQQVEDKRKLYERGKIPRKSIDVLLEAIEEAEVRTSLSH